MRESMIEESTCSIEGLQKRAVSTLLSCDVPQDPRRARQGLDVEEQHMRNYN